MTLRLTAAGTTLPAGTPDDLAATLDGLIQSRQRVRLFYGDPTTGDMWLEDCNVTGWLARSRGPQHVPLLLHNCRSRAGVPVPVEHILRIQVGFRMVWQHPAFRFPILRLAVTTDAERPLHVYRQDVEVAAFRTLQKARLWVRFQQGTALRPS